MDAERTSGLLVTSGFTHTIPFPAMRSPIPFTFRMFEFYLSISPTQQMFTSLFCIAGDWTYARQELNH